MWGRAGNQTAPDRPDCLETGGRGGGRKRGRPTIYSPYGLPKGREREEGGRKGEVDHRMASNLGREGGEGEGRGR